MYNIPHRGVLLFNNLSLLLLDFSIALATLQHLGFKVNIEHIVDGASRNAFYNGDNILETLKILNTNLN